MKWRRDIASAATAGGQMMMRCESENERQVRQLLLFDLVWSDWKTWIIAQPMYDEGPDFAT